MKTKRVTYKFKYLFYRNCSKWKKRVKYNRSHLVKGNKMLLLSRKLRTFVFHQSVLMFLLFIFFFVRFLGGTIFHSKWTFFKRCLRNDLTACIKYVNIDFENCFVSKIKLVKFLYVHTFKEILIYYALCRSTTMIVYIILTRNIIL